MNVLASLFGREWFILYMRNAIPGDYTHFTLLLVLIKRFKKDIVFPMMYALSDIFNFDDYGMHCYSVKYNSFSFNEKSQYFIAI